MTVDSSPLRVAVLHGAGYVGAELIRLLLAHPHADISAVTSRTFAGQPVAAAHPALRGVTDLAFVAPDAHSADDFDAAFVCAEHGQGAAAVSALRDAGFDGLIVDLSADHRLKDAALYPRWYGLDHPAPKRLAEAVYGLAEIHADAIAEARLVANPGCFATGLTLALCPLARHLDPLDAHVTALTGASGSGGRPSATTHFPSRDGNVRAYKVLAHQHLAEVQQLLGPSATVRFVPASGPWTRGIWGTAHVELPYGVTADDVAAWFADAYGAKPFVRLSPGVLPELLPVVGSPFCDLGWVVQDEHLVVGFALDNLLKGAASQAVQNLNLALGLPETAGLLPASPVLV
ncbi:MAG: N-acetyl-gamma-glutamyl-phosphate reductase [Rhodothermales bacterium]